MRALAHIAMVAFIAILIYLALVSYEDEKWEKGAQKHCEQIDPHAQLWTVKGLGFACVKGEKILFFQRYK